MKILYIAPDITDSGGISRVLSLKTNYLVNQFKYDVSILSVNDCLSNRFYDFEPAIKWYNCKESKNTILFLKNYISFIQKTISAEKPDSIVVCDAVLWLFIPWLIKTEIPIIFETHFSVFFGKSKNKSLYSQLRAKLIRFLKQKTISKFTCLVTLTKEESWGRNAKNSIVIPNPLPFTVNNKAALANKKAMAVCMNPYVKGLDRLVLIWSKIVKKHPDWELDVYGNWESNDVFHKMVSDLKIETHVNFLPPTTDIQNCYNQSSLFLMTSRTESFGMVLIEAMASGVPCIAYDCPTGPRAIIDEGITGFLIEDGNLDSFVQKTELLIEDENLRILMSENAKNSVSKYDLDSVMMQWKSFFEEIKNIEF
jgi:glycosyltransferase involved in cell wall biosynthesis